MTSTSGIGNRLQDPIKCCRVEWDTFLSNEIWQNKWRDLLGALGNMLITIASACCVSLAWYYWALVTQLQYLSLMLMVHSFHICIHEFWKTNVHFNRGWMATAGIPLPFYYSCPTFSSKVAMGGLEKFMPFYESNPMGDFCWWSYHSTSGRCSLLMLQMQWWHTLKGHHLNGWWPCVHH